MKLPISLIRPAALLASLAALAGGPATVAAQSWFPSNDSLTALLKTRVGSTGVGMVLGVMDADGTTRVVSYGSPGLNARPLGAQSVFEMGSVTKVFTGILLADLVESGKVSLSDPVQKYLPAGVKMPTRGGREITLLDLATHRSSLTRMATNMRGQPGDAYPSYTVPELYEFLNGHQLRRDIGSEYEYSNIAVALLGHVIERVNGGTPYEQLVQEKILRPLGMTGSSTKIENVREFLTVGHGENGLAAQYRGWETLPGMGALRSNAEDMLRFLAANVAEPTTRLHRILRLSHEPRAVVTPNADIGLNWQIQKYGTQRIITHGGATEGFRSQIAFDPDAKRGVVILLNYPGAGADIAYHLLNPKIPLSGSLATERVQIDVAENVLREYVGDYEVTPVMSINVTMENGALFAQATGQNRFAIFPESHSLFFSRTPNLQIAFTRDSARKVTGFVLHQGGRERPARRRIAPGVPLASAAEIAAALPGRKTTITSKVFGGERALRIVTPAGYEMTQSMRYPVLVVFEAARPVHSAASVAAAMAQAGEGPQVLVVNVAGALTGADRGKVARFITDELQPWVAKEYRSEPLAIVVGDEATVAAARAPASIAIGAAAGARASFRGQRQPASTTTDPHAALGESLRWLFNGWKLENITNLAESPDSGWKAIDAHYAALSRRFGFTAVPSEDLLDDAAGSLARQQRIPDAVRAFERNTVLHPGSAVTWNHLGDGLRVMCKREESKAAYTKALGLATAMSYPNVSNYQMELSRVTTEMEQNTPCTPPGAARATVPVAESVLRSYVGEYALSARISITVTFEGGRLRAQPTGEPARPLGALSEARFFVEGSSIEMTFTKDAAGTVTGMTVHQGGRDLPATKVK